MNPKTGLLVCVIAVTLGTVCGRFPPDAADPERYDREVLQTPTVTNWGQWGKWQKCDPRFLVTGFQLLVEAKENDIDNTALNGVGFICGRPHLPDYKEMAIITSKTGPFGTYTNKSFCAENQYAIGIQMKAQAPQGDADDVAAINLKLICSDGEELEGYNEYSDEYLESYYSKPVVCSQGTAICGVQTQVESFQGFGDDTTLNNIRISCCEVRYQVPGAIQSSTTDVDYQTSTTEDYVQTTQDEDWNVVTP